MPETLPDAPVRIDNYLVKNSYFPTRQKAQAAILAGEIKINNKIIRKAGYLLKAKPEITVKKKIRYVSRGGIKLEKALAFFKINVNNSICLDIGSSTGGFTDCLLQHNAARVYCVDCGTNQLAYKIRQDTRVKVWENTNARYLNKNKFKEKADLLVIDLSFISVQKVLPVMPALLRARGRTVLLFKPQFEAERDRINRGGVVKDREYHCLLLKKFLNFLNYYEYLCRGMIPSPLKGAKGNIEYLFYIELLPAVFKKISYDVRATVNAAFAV
ncbi:MAG TPA: TlyA family RNA methyltransferase [Spirochaetota bacterium]|nr:TlyA family RNA methyltransferase [Spirochaetota bacterium]